MPIFSQESLEQLRQRIDIVEVISSHIELQPAGAVYKALCPFHDEKTPSFTVHRGGMHYHCFGCGVHGDAIQFLMDYLRMTFSEAIESLAERFQVRLEKVEGGSEESSRERKKMREALQLAAEFFHFMLLHSEEGHTALEYLYSRGFTLEFLRRFMIGYAPRQSMLRKLLHDKQFRDPILLKAGLIADRRGRFVDFFSDRITFPMHHPTGYVVGFSARKFKEETFGGKYINTPETPLFKKARLLFGLNYCRRQIAKGHKAIIVEGQIDALAMIDAGFEFTVAAQGTAFGQGHVKELISLGVKKVYLAFDADQAGRQAAVKVGHLFQSAGIAAFCVIMPQGKDPDTLLKEEGKEKMAELLEKSFDYLTFVVEGYASQGALNTPEGKNQVMLEIVKQVRQWEQPLLVYESLRKLAKLLKVPEQMVGVGQEVVPNFHIKQSATAGLFEVDPDRILERDLLRWLILGGEKLTTFLQLAKDNLSEQMFFIPASQEVFRTFIKRFENEESCDLLSLAASLSSEGQGLLAELSEKRVDREKAELYFHETVMRLLNRNWMQAREQIREKIQSGALSESEKVEQVKQFTALSKQPPKIKKREV